MKIKKFSLITLIVTFLFIVGCKNPPIYQYGLIRDSGEVAVDGCGWIIEINALPYSPTNLSDDFKQDSLEVEIDFEESGGSFQCGFSTTLKQINIKEINRL